jgi:lipoate-protein ligase A
MARYYSHFAADPYFNMAFDEWMFEKALSEAGVWHLRLYTWDRPAITFGLNQIYEKALDHSKRGDLPVIRRVTGGRALLHDPSELTYSLAINTAAVAGAAAVAAASELSASIAQTLVEFLRCLKIECECVRRSSAQNSHPDFFHKAPCFASASRYEIVQGNRKIIASAQRRLEHTVFQHGSMKVGGVASHPAVSLTRHPGTTLESPEPIDEKSFRYMEQQFMGAWGRALDQRMVECDLSQREHAEVVERVRMVQKKYSHRRDIFKQK